nr:MAG TPA: hypothetical protein [Caudoviricetes sp.]
MILLLNLTGIVFQINLVLYHYRVNGRESFLIRIHFLIYKSRLLYINQPI